MYNVEALLDGSHIWRLLGWNERGDWIFEHSVCHQRVSFPLSDLNLDPGRRKQEFRELEQLHIAECWGRGTNSA